MSKKRTLHSFFSAGADVATKKARVDVANTMKASPPTTTAPSSPPHNVATTGTQPPPPPSTHSDQPLPSMHPTYPFPIGTLPPELSDLLSFSPYTPGRHITDAPDLDLLYFHPYIPPTASSTLFKFLRSSLPFYRVVYTIKRGAVETVINTPRFTTVFGLDETALFSPSDPSVLLDAKTKKPLPKKTYACTPRPLPACLEALRKLTEASTGHKYNFCLVNYYADGKDSISYHSDDERFLGPEPAIASFSLGASRDFMLRHKPPPPASNATSGAEHDAIQAAHAKPRKFELQSGDMVVMQGRTQGCWLHSIPKRSGKESGRGRINITFRRAMVRGGTENYARYNIGEGPVYVWSEEAQEMRKWDGSGRERESALQVKKEDGGR